MWTDIVDQVQQEWQDYSILAQEMSIYTWHGFLCGLLSRHSADVHGLFSSVRWNKYILFWMNTKVGRGCGLKIGLVNWWQGACTRARECPLGSVRLFSGGKRRHEDGCCIQQKRFRWETRSCFIHPRHPDALIRHGFPLHYACGTHATLEARAERHNISRLYTVLSSFSAATWMLLACWLKVDPTQIPQLTLEAFHCGVQLRMAM